ncbi:hypothetical protein SE15_07975 [Thermanaerothrix daxensis]|uniref:YwiC-like protein n=1 Tax=Thermanaerothrix daxensis TaxID=869279 RepID=A0A0P6YDW6_9CHLR|nr:YwiC-like family protein [Thermanaerothrix daxensis]KPL83183.1 hypothetical protein SE15_07975 [Thermanaerothrix daxensis]
MDSGTLSRNRPAISSFLRRDLALPQEHGAWVFLLSPLTIGLATASQVLNSTSLILLLTALAAFLARHPLTLVVKVYSGRRPRADLPGAFFWLTVYGLLALLGLGVLIIRNHTFLLWLVLPAFPLLGTYLYLVSQRAERHRPILDIATASVLALGAPAAHWTAQGGYSPSGWWLWGLCCLHALGSISHAFMRLEQRRWVSVPPLVIQLKTALPALISNFVALGLVGWLAAQHTLPQALPLPYALQTAETLLGAWKPALGHKPTQIGLRQLGISALFTLLFIVLWRLTPPSFSP